MTAATLPGLEVPDAPQIRRHASLSPCGTYRYTLHRAWDTPARSEPRVTFVMLNPSTADAERDDPTLLRCMAFARSWGYAALDVLNLYAYRATDPKVMLQLDERTAVGPRNDAALAHAALTARLLGEPIVAAWGANARPERVAAVLTMPGMDRLHCLGTTLADAPKHPLARGRHRIPNDAPLIPWTPPPVS